MSNHATYLISFLKKAFFRCGLQITGPSVPEITSSSDGEGFHQSRKKMLFEHLPKPYEPRWMYAETNLLVLAQVTSVDGLVVIIDRCTGEVWCGAVGLWTRVRSMGPLHASQDTASDWVEVRDCQWENRIFEADGWHGMHQTFRHSWHFRYNRTWLLNLYSSTVGYDWVLAETTVSRATYQKVPE